MSDTSADQVQDARRDGGSVSGLSRTVALLTEAVDAAVTDLEQQSAKLRVQSPHLPAPSPYVMKDMAGRYLLLDALASLANAQAALTTASKA